MMTRTFTHKGWLGIAPIYIADLESGNPCLQARHPALEWLVDLSGALLGLMLSFAGPEHPGFPIRVTGELQPPLTVTAE